jgi:signal transduction histidine kinase/response regulator RpfG family c-di-GMP phosphodiesterase
MFATTRITFALVFTILLATPLPSKVSSAVVVLCDAGQQVIADDEATKELLAKAKMLFRKAKYSEARKLIQQGKRRLGDSNSAIRIDFEFTEAGIIANETSDYKTAIKLVTQCLNRARNLGDQPWEWKSLRMLGVFTKINGRTLLSTRYHQQALELATSRQEKYRQDASTLDLAQSLIKSRMILEAKELLDGLQINKQHNDLETALCICMARIEVKTGQSKRAVKRVEQYMAQRTANKEAIGYSAYNCLGGLYVDQGRLDEAEANYSRLIADKGIMSKLTVHHAKLGMARVEILRGSYSKALGILDALLASKTTLDLRSQTLTRKIDCALRAGKSGLAKSAFHELDRCEEKLQVARMEDEVVFLNEQAAYRKTLREQQAAKNKLSVMEDKLAMYRHLQLFGTLFSAGAIFGIIACGFSLLKRRMAEKDLLTQSKLLEQETKLTADLKERIQVRVSEIEQQQQEQVQLEKRLSIKRRDEAIGQLTGGVAHDFNNLIMVIENVNELLSQSPEGELTSESRELIACSNRAAQAASEITNRLLAFAKKQDLAPDVINLRQFFNEYQPLLQQVVARFSGINIAICENASIYADETQLVTALINLCTNSGGAFEDSEDQPKLTITVRCQSNQDWCNEKTQRRGTTNEVFATPTFNQADSSQLVIVSVADNGCGMTREQLIRACDPFYSTRKESLGHEFGGTGLGLSVVKGFLEQSYAGMEICSEVGVGTTVRMIFPIVGDGPTRTLPKIQTNIDFSGLRVLLVDDNEMILMSLRSMLESIDCKVTTVVGGTLAQNLLKDGKNEFDIVMTDVRMPDSIDGITLADWIEKNQTGLPVILMSGFSDGTIDSKHVFLAKPFDSTAMQNALHSVIKRYEIEAPTHQLGQKS